MPTSPEVLRRTGGRQIASIVYDEAAIAGQVAELGARITAAYPEGDLVRKIERPLQVDFLVASSYGAGTTSSGDVRLVYDPETRLENKHIVLVEDIVDTGNTVRRLMGLLRQRRPASIAVCALLDKADTHAPIPDVRFIGFRAPPAFLVGYGLDHAEDFRHLPFIADLM